MTPRSRATRWKWCLITSLAMAFLSLIPQIHLWVVRGRDWNGAYVVTQGDEPLYSGYVNALIDGRPRKTDPFGGRDSTSDHPLPESTFSIQFMPAYALALMGRLFRVSTSTAFIAHAAVTAFFASIVLFWLLELVIGDFRAASAGTFFVLCFGGVVATYGLFGTFVDGAIPPLSFLRRYEPAAAFPLFFLFQMLVWLALICHRKRDLIVTGIAAGLVFAILIFSYLYLWTAALAWLVCVSAIWFFLRAPDRRRTLALLATVLVIGCLALLPYAYMLSHRALALDEQHTLINTHKLDVLRLTEVIGGLILIGLIVGRTRYKFGWADARIIFAISLALLPFVVFNQQIITGRVMQNFHFDAFIINYSTVAGLMIAASLWLRNISSRVLAWLGILSLMWGLFSVGLTGRLVFVPGAVARDQKIPVLLRLQQLSYLDGTRANLSSKGQSSTLVFSPDLAVTVLLPTWTSQGTLLDIGGVECGVVSRQERKEFFYTHLYYSMVDPGLLRNALNGTVNHPAMESYARIVVFGSERVSPVLSNNFKPIQNEEIEREVGGFDQYGKSFSREEAMKRPLAYAIIPLAGNFDFTNLDRWYERDAGERVGDYVLYRLKLRP